MAKPKKKGRKIPPSGAASRKETARSSLLEFLETTPALIGYVAVVFVLALILYSPIVFEGKEVTGGDAISGIGKTKQIKEYYQRTGHRPLWNPYMFAGMPMYHRHNPVSWSVDTLVDALDPLVDWRVWYLVLGAVGMFLLVKFLRLSAVAGMVAGLGFMMIPHFHALIVVGHFAKFRAIVWIPFVLLTFLWFLERRNLLGMFLFTTAFALQMRTQHYQIIFYTLLLLLFTGVVPYVNMIREKRRGEFARFTGMLLAALVLVILIVAQPLLPTREYTPYSTRGGQSVSIYEQVSEQEKKGVGFDYATNWSYTVAEFWNLIIPKFHGGTSREVYTGDAVPQLRGREIPAYWGDLPFTQSYEYMGILLVFLALVGIVFEWRHPLVKSLTLLMILALLLSLGKHFAGLYRLLFYYLPYFDKFRAPMMILNLVAVIVYILAAFGLHRLVKGGLREPTAQKRFFILAALVGMVLVIPLLIGSSLSLARPDEVQQYPPQTLEILRKIRLEILTASTWRTLLFYLVGAGILAAGLRRLADWGWVALGLLLLVGVDMGSLSAGYLKGKFADPRAAEAQVYAENALDRKIKQDTTLYRVLPPLRRVANDTRYSYHFQSIGGYSAAKLQVIQDIIENNLVFRERSGDGLPFNLNVVSMLNGKYIVAERSYNHPDLLHLLGQQMGEGAIHLYRNRRVLPRAFFVDSVRVIPDGVERLRFMNTPDFDPARIALLEEPPEQPVSAPDSSHAEVVRFEPDALEVNVYTDRRALLVLSEVYYPRGWKATLETGERLKIYKTNHLLRSMIVPPGEHTITLEFRPASYYTGIKLSWLGWLITYVGMAVVAFRRYRGG
ncbi:MAG: hypothetical protein D6681_11755 [Calditrichaeota bacterium]|nr:MAG: hypothetical protein D6681_11755 [Calditrichota bacterium]